MRWQRESLSCCAVQSRCVSCGRAFTKGRRDVRTGKDPTELQTTALPRSEPPSERHSWLVLALEPHSRGTSSVLPLFASCRHAGRESVPFSLQLPVFQTLSQDPLPDHAWFTPTHLCASSTACGRPQSPSMGEAACSGSARSSLAFPVADGSLGACEVQRSRTPPALCSAVLWAPNKCFLPVQRDQRGVIGDAQRPPPGGG